MANESFLKDMGTRINLRRKELHITQETLAEKMDVSIQMISNLELGKKAIRPENLSKLCDILDVSADYILSGRLSARETDCFIDKYSRLSIDDRSIIDCLTDRLLNE